MARVAIVSYDVQTINGKSGGVAAFTTRWARLLRASGEDVTIIMTRIDWEPMAVDLTWKARYQAWGIGLIELQTPPPLATRWPEVPTVRMSEMLAPVLKNFDIVYCMDWGNGLFHLLRERQYAVGQGPVCVTQLFGPSEWEQAGNERFPELPRDLHLAYQERYAAKRCDFAVASSQYMVDALRRIGWAFPGEVSLLGLPMADWDPAPAANSTPQIKKIVYFARIEERKGIRLFVQALTKLAKDGVKLPEVVLFGGVQHPELLESAMRELRSARIDVSHKLPIDSESSLRFLREGAQEILCVMPAPSDNYPYTIVEASTIPGLNWIATTGGGVTQMFDADTSQHLCDATPRAMAELIGDRLAHPLPAQEVLRYDIEGNNRKWLDFHTRALATREATVQRSVPLQRPTVDVCTTYFQKPKYLPQFFEALTHQTAQDFHVIAVNDGSPDAASNEVFERTAEKAHSRGWDFFRQENMFVDAARNRAAARGRGEYILFVDSDDVPALHAVERMRDAMRLSGMDALIPSSYLFASDTLPYNIESGEVTAPAFARIVPLGMDLVGGLIDPASFGGSMFMLKRSAFEAVGGFTEQPGAGHEDWELYVRLALAGFQVDVLPEMLQFYRQVEGSLARTLRSEASRKRLLGPYEERLREAGLGGAALALVGLYENSKSLEKRISTLEARVNAPQGGYAFFSGASGRFEPEHQGVNMGRLQSWYRGALSLETRLKIHRIFLAPFLGPYEPPRA